MFLKKVEKKKEDKVKFYLLHQHQEQQGIDLHTPQPQIHWKNLQQFCWGRMDFELFYNDHTKITLILTWDKIKKGTYAYYEG